MWMPNLGIAAPPNLKRLVGSSVRAPGACMTPSMETWAPATIVRMGHPPCLSYSISVSVPVAISAAAQITSRFIQARRSMPTPSFSNTSTAMNAVTAR